jgi:hypothetical protein
MLNHHTRRAPIWIFRGLLAWLPIKPNAELVELSCGALKVTRLVVLKRLESELQVTALT